MRNRDLFDNETLNHKIGGREFDRKDSNKEKYYNKDIFSKYVLSNFASIDFTNFRPMLDSINRIVEKYISPPEDNNVEKKRLHFVFSAASSISAYYK